MFRTFFILSLITQAGACSIVQPHPDATEALRATRTLGGVTVENHSRWTLPPFARVTVMHADGRTDNERLLAVQTGLAAHLQVADAESPWRLVVYWPDPVHSEEPAVVAPAAYWSTQTLRSAGTVVTRTADRDELLVDVIHNADNSLVTRLTVVIAPWLRGRDWHDPVELTRAFAAVGATLTGS